MYVDLSSCLSYERRNEKNWSLMMSVKEILKPYQKGKRGSKTNATPTSDVRVLVVHETYQGLQRIETVPKFPKK